MLVIILLAHALDHLLQFGDALQLFLPPRLETPGGLGLASLVASYALLEAVLEEKVGEQIKPSASTKVGRMRTASAATGLRVATGIRSGRTYAPELCIVF